MMLQLNPPIPVVTPNGKALAHFLIDEGVEHDLYWVCIQNGTGECWTFSNQSIRGQKNITQNREHISPFYDPQSVAFPSRETSFEKQIREAKRMSVTDPFFEQYKTVQDDQDEDIHKCCLGEFTCHYLSGVLTLTCQENGRDSIHTLVKMCPFCGHGRDDGSDS